MNTHIPCEVILRNIKIPASDTSDAEAVEQARLRLRKAGIALDGDFVGIVKKSIDARKQTICFVYSVLFRIQNPPKEALLAKIDAQLSAPVDLPSTVKKGMIPLSHRPIIVGFGPCGMFAGLLLAEQGYAPIILERGDCVKERAAAVERFNRTGCLDSDTNIQFGAGGAGTFSDGKLVTRIHDGRCRYVLERFHEFGAPDEILYAAKPHIGTDRLLGIVERIAEYIVSLGGKICYNCRMEQIYTDQNRAKAVEFVHTKTGEKETIPCGALIIAPGHSARDTYTMLHKSGYKLNPKPFSVGVRIEHLQSDIDRALYGKLADASFLGHGEYNLSHRVGERGVYTFCMCPGGEVVAAASEHEGVVVNGMSCYMRDGKNANSAMAVSVLPSDYGYSMEGAIAFQRMLERAAFQAAGEDYSAPIQTVGDFLSDRSGKLPTRILPTYRGGKFVRPCDLGALMPRFVTSMLKLGLSEFGKKIRGFDTPDAILTGFETRTSAPLRIERDEFGVAIGTYNIYPAGEGAGYAGGITSAAVDGIAAALHLMEHFAPSSN